MKNLKLAIIMASMFGALGLVAAEQDISKPTDQSSQEGNIIYQDDFSNKEYVSKNWKRVGGIIDVDNKKLINWVGSLNVKIPKDISCCISVDYIADAPANKKQTGWVGILLASDIACRVWIPFGAHQKTGDLEYGKSFEFSVEIIPDVAEKEISILTRVNGKKIHEQTVDMRGTDWTVQLYSYWQGAFSNFKITKK